MEQTVFQEVAPDPGRIWIDTRGFSDPQLEDEQIQINIMKQLFKKSSKIVVIWAVAPDNRCLVLLNHCHSFWRLFSSV